MGDWKLVWSGEVAANQTHGPETETWELFDLAQDPFEENNLAEARPEILADLKSALQAYQKEAVEPNISPNTMPESFKVPEVWGE